MKVCPNFIFSFLNILYTHFRGKKGLSFAQPSRLRPTVGGPGVWGEMTTDAEGGRTEEKEEEDVKGWMTVLESLLFFCGFVNRHKGKPPTSHRQKGDTHPFQSQHVEGPRRTRKHSPQWKGRTNRVFRVWRKSCRRQRSTWCGKRPG